MFSDKLIKWEKYFFLLLVAVHLIPILSVDFFVTLDGPAHVYHASLISRLLSGNTHASEFMILNPEPVPYWTAQFILSVMNQFFSGNISEKIFIGIYVVTLPIAFRKFILTVSAQSAWVSYLIFPFIYSFLLYIGFYNFCIALPVFFFTLHVFLSGKIAMNRNKILILLILILLIYFSHLFVLAVFFLFTATFLVVNNLFVRTDDVFRIKKLLIKIGFILLVSLPTLLLTLHFLLINKDKQFYNSHLAFSELMEWLTTARPIITFKYDGEGSFAIIIAATTGMLIVGMLYSVWKKKYHSEGTVWIVFSMLILVLYFFLPNNLSTGGFVSMRLLLFIYLFLFTWFTAGHFHPALKNAAVILFVSVSIYFLKYHRDVGKVLSENAKEYYSVTGHIKENSIVLPLDYSDNWMHNNIAAYIGTCHTIFMLEDYDASSPHFPVIWKPNLAPHELLGKYLWGNPPCADIDNFESKTKIKIDYITRWHYNPAIQDSCTFAMNSKIEKDFTRIFVSSSGEAELFLRKK